MAVENATKLNSEVKARIFVTFADSRYKASLSRIKLQAEKIDVYTKIYVFTESDFDINFVKLFPGLVKPGIRGFGYWCWKPYLILKVLNESDIGSIIHWVDAGCWLRLEGRKRLLEYFEIAEGSKVGIVGFQADQPICKTANKQNYMLPEKQWTKGDILDYFNVRGQSSIVDSNQIEATTLFVKNCEPAVSIIKNWYEVYLNHFHLVDDSPSISPNDKCFIENRHDQSVVSILIKLHNGTVLPAFETYYPIVKKGMKPGQCLYQWDAIGSSPIWAKRDLSRGLIADLILKGRIKWRKLLAIAKIAEYKRPW
jgi:hypothetical protein